MTEQEYQTITSNFQALIKDARAFPPVQLIMDIPTLFMVLANLQLALRHEANTGPAAVEVKALVVRCIDIIRHDTPELAAVLDAGFEPANTGGE